jgi:Tfp pilus assembly protein PilF
MNKNLLIAAIGIGILIFLAFAYYRNVAEERFPGENKYRLGSRYLEDGKYEEALPLFDEAIALKPGYKAAFLAKAITLMQLERMDESRLMFDTAIVEVFPQGLGKTSQHRRPGRLH